MADHYPIRSPLVVADFLIHNVEGKTFAEIGTRNGDVSKCVAQFTKRAFAVEMEESYCRRLVQRGIEVECMRFEKVPDKRLVGVDVFFWFMGSNCKCCGNIYFVLAKKNFVYTFCQYLPLKRITMCA